ncbi:MAG: hypothetical protein P8163_08825 [Candidatus Thiodiazotropha sp.]
MSLRDQATPPLNSSGRAILSGLTGNSTPGCLFAWEILLQMYANHREQAQKAIY